MPLYENFPYTNFHELNLDWLVERVAALEAAFPEGTIGISKGGTGADNAAQARENLGIIAPNIPIAEGSTSTLDQEISRLEDNINSLAGDIKYRIFRVVTDLGLTSGTATLSSCWAAMSIGDILIAPPSEFAPEQVPENSGSVVLVRDAGTSGSLRFYGDRTYEQPFANNYPSGTWNTILNDTDVIPVNKGGTGATTPDQARQNLGIDFSGTVLSVAGVGADTAGNVPLKLDNLVYNALSELGLASGSTLAAVWTALPENSLLIANGAEISDPPVSDAGSLEIYKGTSTVPGFIRFHGKESSTGDYAMYLTAAGIPSGTWEEVGAGTVETINLTPQCTFPKGAPGHAYVLRTGKMVQVFYQGPSASYAMGDVLISLPVSLDSSITDQVFAPFVLNAVTFGIVVLSQNSISVHMIGSNSGNYRIYFQMAFPCAD